MEAVQRATTMKLSRKIEAPRGFRRPTGCRPMASTPAPRETAGRPRAVQVAMVASLPDLSSRSVYRTDGCSALLDPVEDSKGSQ